MRLLLLVCAACHAPAHGDTPSGGSPTGGAGDSAVDSADSAAHPETWNIAFYVAADSNLNPFVDGFLAKLEEVGSSPTVNVLVQVDRSEDFNPEGTWTGTRRYRIEADGDPEAFTSPLIEDLGELDMGDPDTLVDFLEWGDSWPAERTMLAFWGHSAAWHLGGDAAPVAPGVGDDAESRSSISIAQGELTLALDARVQHNGPFDVIFFEGCFQSGWETAFAVRDETNWMVASQTRVAMDGVAWADLLAWMAARDAPVASSAVADAAAQNAVLTGRNASFSALDLVGVEALGVALDGVVGAILADPALAGPFRAACDPSPPTDPRSNLFLDLGACAQAMLDGGEPGLAVPAEALSAAVAGVVGSVYAGEGFAWQTGFNAVSTQNAEDLSEYQAAIWAEASLWDDLIAFMTANP